MAKTICIIEDEKPLVEAISQYLEASGYRVISALNGKKAKELLSKERPDLILLDIVLPEMNGIDFLKEMQKSDSQIKDIPVIVFSNLVGEKSWIEQMGLHVVDYMVKANSSLAEVGERIKKFLG